MDPRPVPLSVNEILSRELWEILLRAVVVVQEPTAMKNYVACQEVRGGIFYQSSR